MCICICGANLLISGCVLIECTSGLVRLLIYLFFKFNKSEKGIIHRYVPRYVLDSVLDRYVLEKGKIYLIKDVC